MVSWRFIKGFVCFVAIGVASLCYIPVMAVEQSGQKNQSALGVSPALTELVLEPGQPKSLTLIVTNITDIALPIKAVATNFQLQEEITEKDRAQFDASKWVRVAEPDFILHPRQQKIIDVTITPPTNAEPGGHYTTIFFQPLVPTETIKDNAVFIGSKIGVQTLLIIKGDVQQAATISNLEIPLFNEQGPADMRVHIKNSGNVHVMSTGSIEVSDMWGKHVDTVPLPPTLVLPKTTKIVPIKWDNGQRAGYFSAEVHGMHGAEHSLLKSESRSFWIFPWLNIVVLLCIVGLVGFMFWRTRGRWCRALSILFSKTEAKSRPEK